MSSSSNASRRRRRLRLSRASAGDARAASASGRSGSPSPAARSRPARRHPPRARRRARIQQSRAAASAPAPRWPGRPARSRRSRPRRRCRTTRPRTRSGSCDHGVGAACRRRASFEPRLVEPRRLDLPRVVVHVAVRMWSRPRRRPEARCTSTSSTASSSPKSSAIVSPRPGTRIAADGGRGRRRPRRDSQACELPPGLEPHPGRSRRAAPSAPERRIVRAGGQRAGGSTPVKPACCRVLGVAATGSEVLVEAAGESSRSSARTSAIRPGPARGRGIEDLLETRLESAEGGRSSSRTDRRSQPTLVWTAGCRIADGVPGPARGSQSIRRARPHRRTPAGGRRRTHLRP